MSEITGAYIPKEKIKQLIWSRVPEFFNGLSLGMATGVVSGIEHAGSSLGEASMFLHEPDDAPRFFAAGQHSRLQGPISPGQKPNDLSLGQKAQIGPFAAETLQADFGELNISHYAALNIDQKSVYGELVAEGLPHDTALRVASGEWRPVVDGVTVDTDL